MANGIGSQSKSYYKSQNGSLRDRKGVDIYKSPNKYKKRRTEAKHDFYNGEMSYGRDQDKNTYKNYKINKTVRRHPINDLLLNSPGVSHNKSQNEDREKSFNIQNGNHLKNLVPISPNKNHYSFSKVAQMPETPPPRNGLNILKSKDLPPPPPPEEKSDCSPPPPPPPKIVNKTSNNVPDIVERLTKEDIEELYFQSIAKSVPMNPSIYNRNNNQSQSFDHVYNVENNSFNQMPIYNAPYHPNINNHPIPFIEPHHAKVFPYQVPQTSNHFSPHVNTNLYPTQVNVERNFDVKSSYKQFLPEAPRSRNGLKNNLNVFPEKINITGFLKDLGLFEILKTPKEKMKLIREQFNKVEKQESKSIDCFKKLMKVGQGTYGKVYKAIDKTNEKLVALKKIRMELDKEGFPITSVREIKVLCQLQHENIVQLYEVISNRKNSEGFMNSNDNFYLVFEFMDHDLMGVLESRMVEFTLPQIKSIFKQLILALDFCHKKNFLHRDLKCSNILINNKGVIKLADFGLARLFESDCRPYTNKVITLWYRPPELLLGEERYGPYVDIWSVGCILAQLFTRNPILPGSNELEQYDLICRMCGTPNSSTWPLVTELPYYNTIKPRRRYDRSLKHKLKQYDVHAVTLIDKILVMDPFKRINAEKILNSDFLKDVVINDIEPPQIPENHNLHELQLRKWHAERKANKKS